MPLARPLLAVLGRLGCPPCAAPLWLPHPRAYLTVALQRWWWPPRRCTSRLCRQASPRRALHAALRPARCCRCARQPAAAGVLAALLLLLLLVSASHTLSRWHTVEKQPNATPLPRPQAGGAAQGLLRVCPELLGGQGRRLHRRAQVRVCGLGRALLCTASCAGCAASCAAAEADEHPAARRAGAHRSRGCLQRRGAPGPRPAPGLSHI